MTRFLLVSLLLTLAGCASRMPAPRTQIAQPACAAGFDLSGSQRLGLDAGQPLEHRFDEASPCVKDAAGASTVYALFRMPAVDKPYLIEIDSQPVGAALFAPEVLTLDTQGQVLRTLAWDRFSTRGEELSGTLFVNAENAGERYLVVRSVPAVVGQKITRLASGSYFVPFINLVFPMAYIHGTETEREYVLAHSGLIRLHARSADQARRGRAARDSVRKEMGGH